MDNIVDITLPTGWRELSPKQLKYVFGLLAANVSEHELLLFCLLRWSGLRVESHVNGASAYTLRRDRKRFAVADEMLAAATSSLRWLLEMPECPFNLPGHHVDILFREVPFSIYMSCDNLYQGYIATSDQSLLDGMAAHIFGRRRHLDEWQRVMVFYYFTALKNDFSRRWPHFLQPAGASTQGNLLESSTPAQRVRESVDAQLRALTKGDITKEQLVLGLDTWRALTELDALARESREFAEKYGK